MAEPAGLLIGGASMLGPLGGLAWVCPADRLPADVRTPCLPGVIRLMVEREELIGDRRLYYPAEMATPGCFGARGGERRHDPG